MTPNTRRIITLTVRFQNAVEAAQERAADAFERDAAFDGGEFSGPAIERALRREEEQLARRFGFANADLAYGIADHFGAILRQPASLHGLPLPLLA